MPFIGESEVRRIKQAIDLVQLMGEFTPLRKAGGQFTGCCAFHSERTPSMYVYPDDQHYHCFGCGAHGDAVNLIMDKERLEFADAVAFLARRAGLEIRYEERGGKPQLAQGSRDKLAAAMEQATRLYEAALWNADEAAPAREYLARRKLSVEVCRRFRLGWSLGRGTLVNELRRVGFSPQQLLDLDLAVDRDGRVVDRFYERVMFPICDRFGGPIGFSARLLPEAERAAKEAGRGVGKYVNSTDTPLYRKSAHVFNLHRARLAVRERERLIVMEGPTDVMAADQAGFPECVAVLGTALTPEHARTLGNLAGREGGLVLLLDGDRAGVANGLKAVKTCLAAGVGVKVALLPDELDPAELLAEGAAAGPDALSAAKGLFDRVIGQARGDLDHLLRMVAPQPHALDARALLAATDEILAALRPVPDAELRRLHLRDAAAWLGMPQDRLERRLGDALAAAAVVASTAPAASLATPTPDDPAAPAAPAAAVPLSGPSELVFHALVREPELRSTAFDDLHLEPNHVPAPWSGVLAALHLAPLTAAVDVADLPACADPLVRAAAQRAAITPLSERRPAIDDPRAALGDAVRQLVIAAGERELHRLRLAEREASARGDFPAALAAARALGDMRKRLAALQGRDKAVP